MTCASCGNDLDPSSPEVCLRCENAPGVRPPGERIARRYRIERLLGRGGMGAVYLVHDDELDERLALKLLNPEVVQAESISRRFKQEVKLARRVTHENVCRIHEYGVDGDTAFIIMEFVDGVDLEVLVRERGAMRRTDAVAAVAQVARGLQAIHDLGIVHRDMKTANLVRDRSGNIRIMDFGIARRVTQETLAGNTAVGQAIGTPHYMSPEQAQGLPLDARSDIYSLGVVLYELLTGQVPFRADSLARLLYMLVNEEPQLDDAACVPPHLAGVLKKSLAKRPQDRFATAEELAQELLRAEREWVRKNEENETVAHPVSALPPGIRPPRIDTSAAPPPDPATTALPVAQLLSATTALPVAQLLSATTALPVAPLLFATTALPVAPPLSATTAMPVPPPPLPATTVRPVPEALFATPAMPASQPPPEAAEVSAAAGAAPPKPAIPSAAAPSRSASAPKPPPASRRSEPAAGRRDRAGVLPGSGAAGAALLSGARLRAVMAIAALLVVGAVATRVALRVMRPAHSRVALSAADAAPSLDNVHHPNRVLIAGGRFAMGTQKDPDKPGYDPDGFANEAPVHAVTMSAYYIDRHEVTVQQYRPFVDSGPQGYLDQRLWDRDGWAWRSKENRTAPAEWEEQLKHVDWPVVRVSWYEADAYTRWLSRESGQEVALPTEAQWEYAARGSSGRRYPWGDEAPTDRANLGDRVGHPTPAGAYPLGATPEGVYDLAGNAWEWCRDYLGSYGSEPRVDPVGPESATLPRGVRGGAFHDDPVNVRAACRYGYRPESARGDLGFRCVSSSAGPPVSP